MFLESIWIQDLRCIKKAHFELSPQQNVFVGDNGAGKTSVLESLYLLGRGQSFRQTNSRRLISDLSDRCIVRSHIRQDNGTKIAIAIQKQAESNLISISEDRNAKVSDLARLCPVIVLEPGQHRLLEDGPILRRRYLDWSVFHVEHGYLSEWQRFSRALKQRNALLRQGRSNQLDVWDREFFLSAQQLDKQRTAVFDEMLVHIKNLLDMFFGTEHQLQIQYRRGWPLDVSLEEHLKAHRSQDLERGFSQSGPQRAEIRVRSDKHLAKDSLSRGQQKLLITAMLLGQAQHFEKRTGLNPILLIDDLASELGQKARETLFSYLSNYKGQSCVSCLDEMLLPTHYRQTAKMFHVKHGIVEAMV